MWSLQDSRHSAFPALLLPPHSIPLHASASFLLTCTCFSPPQFFSPPLSALLRGSLHPQPTSTSSASFTCCSVFSLLSNGHILLTFIQTSLKVDPVVVAATCKMLNRWQLMPFWYSAPWFFSSSLIKQCVHSTWGAEAFKVLPPLLWVISEPSWAWS